MKTQSSLLKKSADITGVLLFSLVVTFWVGVTGTLIVQFIKEVVR